MEFIKELWTFLSIRKNYGSPHHHCDVDTWRFVNTCTRLCGGTFHIHTLLGVIHVYSGISAFYHDGAACILKDGEIIAAAQEERFSRSDAGFPHQALQYCLKEAGISAKQIDNIVFYEKPFVKFEKLLETYLAFAHKGFTSFAKAMPVWLKDKLFQKSAIIKIAVNS